MYTILLVDDEDEVRKSIRELTPWTEYGFSVIGEASNGREALDFVSETVPDVIITDIRMPYMDGIQFIEEVRKSISPSVDVIILSGYDEFTFAQTAMRLNVAEYVLKPVSVSSMGEVLKRAKERLDNDRAKVLDRNQIEAFYKDAMEIYKEKFLVSLITPTRRLDSTMIEERAETYGVPLKGSLFAVVIIDLPTETLSSVAVEEVIEEGLEDEEGVIPFQYENQIVLIFTSGMQKNFSALFSKQIYRYLSLLQSRVIHYFSKPFNMGIGEIATDVKALSDSYRSALEALNYTQLYPEQHIISISDVETLESDKAINPGELRTELVLAVKFGGKEDTEKAVQAFFQGITETASVQNTVISILSIISEICTSYGRNIATLLEGENLFLALSHANSLSRSEALMIKLALRANEEANGARENSHIQFVEKAKMIIKERYSDPVFGLDQLTDEISVSPAYFSTTFKKETGISFVQYLTSVRLEKAKEMLKNTDAKTYEIAEKAGFSEPNYFSFIFRKNIGISPSQYRAQNRSNSQPL
ncbi:MAG: response regulator [Spirochaetes bacterium]|uniref:Response regulator n=1 Tax=Candidatus Ornithospirochaeta stercoripullorum TaxID=2840899 RepID=A0A9D9H2L9_9SPIO|nr:response regulator [Candidatus Ornithospirochaeta stercoripullorum]